MEPLFF